MDQNSRQPITQPAPIPAVEQPNQPIAMSYNQQPVVAPNSASYQPPVVPLTSASHRPPILLFVGLGLSFLSALGLLVAVLLLTN